LKKYPAAVLSMIISFWSVFFPTNSYALAVADQVKCENPDAKWTKKLSKTYAKLLVIEQYGWNMSEYKALLKLWGKESAWNQYADSPDSTAYGIPQILGLPVGTPAPAQIERGLAYIQHRYERPSIAWAHWRSNKWY